MPTAPVVAPAPVAHAKTVGRPAVRAAALRALMASATTAGVAVLVVMALPFAAHPSRFPLLFVLAGFAVGALRLPAYGTRITLGPLPIVAAAYLYGPGAAAFVGLAVALGVECLPHEHHPHCAFNIGLNVIPAWVAAAVAHLLFPSGNSAPLTLLPFGIVAALLMYGVNIGLLCTALALKTGSSFRAVWHERFRWMLPQTLMLGPVGTGVAAAYRDVGVYELLAFALPVVAMHFAWRQYLAHTTRSVEDLRQKNADLIQLAARLQTANEAVLTTYRGTLEALVGALDARDNEVQGHSYRVSAYSQILAEKLGVERSSAEWEAIARGALLHDVGKIGIRDAVLRKPGKLDEAEWVEMRQHADIGFGILKDIEFLKPAAAMVQAHHERFDGNGYPLGLAGAQIPLGARIFSVSDTFDAMTSDRPYRRAMPPEVAVAEILRCSGSQFDPAVVAVFQQVWPQLWAIRAEAVHMVA